MGGHISLIGASLSLSGAGLDPLSLTGRGITLGSISLGSRADFEAMNRAIVLHRLRPVIDRTFPFAAAKDAYRRFEGRGHFGKVVISHGWRRMSHTKSTSSGQVQFYQTILRSPELGMTRRVRVETATQ